MSANNLSPAKKLWLAIRATIFYTGYYALIGWFGLTAVLMMWLPLKWRFLYVRCWNFIIIHWLAITCGVKFRVHGRENVPKQNCVLIAKHQSQWETFFLLTVTAPIVTVLKKELLRIPFFGWGLRTLSPIAIDRSNPKQAMRDIMSQGKLRLEQGFTVLIFPEGTRVAPGETSTWARSGAQLAIDNNVPILPVAHNAGVYWPARRFIKFPGTIDVFIGKPVDADGRNSKELTEDIKQWIEMHSS
jgi:1-acyl-sn-glycerol-3-phosphate acyltransferase